MAQNIYTGFHAVEERIRRYENQKSKAVTLKIYYSKIGPRIKKILFNAKDAGFECIKVDDEYISNLVKDLPPELQDSRGIVLVTEGEKQTSENLLSVDAWIKTCPEKATVLILDSVTDPHNIGAIIRSCDQFGCNLLVVPERNTTSSIQENDIIARTSAGASGWVSLCKEKNLVRAVQILKENGFWIYAADAGGQSLQNVSFADKACIIMGSEGTGISRLLEENSDVVVSIPTCGKIDSLNVSVAAGVLLFERHRQSL